MRTGALPGIVLAANAGAIASRNGSAIAAPIPRKNVRRGSALRVIIVCAISFGILLGFRLVFFGGQFATPRLERQALHDLKQQRSGNGIPDAASLRLISSTVRLSYRSKPRPSA